MNRLVVRCRWLLSVNFTVWRQITESQRQMPIIILSKPYITKSNFLCTSVWCACILLSITQDALGQSGILNPGVKWRFKTQGTVRGQPLVAGKLIVVGSSDGSLYALDINNGDVRWRTPTGGPITSAPVSNGNAVYCTSDDNFVYALDMATGVVRWKYKMNPLRSGYWEWDYYSASPVVDEGVLWVGSGDGWLYALDAGSGKLKWKYETTGRIRAAPAVSAKVVYVPSNDGFVYALNKVDGKLLWKFRTDGADYDSFGSGWDRNAIYASPIVQDSLMIVASRDGMTYAVNVDTQKRKWTFTYGPSWAMSATVSSGNVFIGWSDNDLLSLVDLQTGKEKWKFKAGSVVYTKPLLMGDQVVIGSADNKVYGLSGLDGKKIWEFRTGGCVFSSPATSNGVVFVGSDDGFVYAIHEKEKPIKAVFHPITNNPGLDQAFLSDASITPWLRERGFLQLDTTTIATFIKRRIADGVPSVIVFAYEQLPQSLIGDKPEQGILRQYLDGGGKVVWFGNVPNLYTFDDKGTPSRDQTRGERMLGVKFIRTEDSGNYYSRTTQAGLNAGLPPWKTFTYANVDGQDVTPLAIDGFGRVTAWMKKYNPRPGSGFFSCRTWGWYAPIHEDDLRIILEIANYELE